MSNVPAEQIVVVQEKNDDNAKNPLARVTKKVVSRVQEIASRFADLLVAAFAVAAGVAWKDSVFWMFSSKGPLGFLQYTTVTLAIAITTVGALLTTIRAYLPLTPKSETFRNEYED